MDALPYLTWSELNRRMTLRRWAETDRRLKGWPVGLHAWPRRKHGDRWFGIGPCSWDENEAVAWFDVRLNSDAAYRALNRMVRRTCEQLQIPFIDMR